MNQKLGLKMIVKQNENVNIKVKNESINNEKLQIKL